MRFGEEKVVDTKIIDGLYNQKDWGNLNISFGEEVKFENDLEDSKTAIGSINGNKLIKLFLIDDYDFTSNQPKLTIKQVATYIPFKVEITNYGNKRVVL